MVIQNKKELYNRRGIPSTLGHIFSFTNLSFTIRREVTMTTTNTSVTTTEQNLRIQKGFFIL